MKTKTRTRIEAPFKTRAVGKKSDLSTGEVVVAHDYFTQRGGAERVAAILVEKFNPALVLTAVIDREATFLLDGANRLLTSPLQHLAPARRDPRWALLLLPAMWRLFRPVQTGLLICSSSGWSHSLRAGANCFKVVYCHNPARWLYQPGDYFRDSPKVIKVSFALLSPLFKVWDRRAARSADLYIANSRVVASRIKAVYGIDAAVLPPPISLDPDGPRDPVAGVPDQYFLAIGRRRGYKNIDVLIDAFRAMPEKQLVIVGDGGPDAPRNVLSVSNLSDAQLRGLYERAQALLSVSFEDFGLTPLEANLFGVPALVLRAGGFLDTVVDGLNGSFIESPTGEAVVVAVRAFEDRWDRGRIRQHVAQFRSDVFAARLLSIVDDGRRPTRPGSAQV